MTPNLVEEDACPVLPDLPMLNIFGHLPVYQLLVTLPEVSPSPTWTKLVNDSCHARRHLTILLGLGAEELLESVYRQFPNLPPANANNQLSFLNHRLSEQVSRVLTSKMPQISSLTLVITRMYRKEYARILQLLHAWADHLTQLIFAIKPRTIGKAYREEALSFQVALNDLSLSYAISPSSSGTGSMRRSSMMPFSLICPFWPTLSLSIWRLRVTLAFSSAQLPVTWAAVQLHGPLTCLPTFRSMTVRWNRSCTCQASLVSPEVYTCGTFYLSPSLSS